MGGEWLASPYVSDKAFEENFVGYLLAKPQAAKEVFGFVRPDHFQFTATRDIAHAMARLVERGRVPDVRAIEAELHVLKSDVSKVEVAALYGNGPMLASVHDAGVRLRDMARRRTVAYALEEALQRLTDEPEFDQVRGGLYGVLDAVEDAQREPDADLYWAVVNDVLLHYQSGDDDHFGTGFASLDQQMPGGIARGSLVVLGARTSVGKTALAATMAVEWAKSGRKVSFISLEMDRLGIGQRLVGAMGEVPVARLNARQLTDAEEERLVQAATSTLSICTDDSARTLAQVRARASQHRRVLGGLDVVIVDYVQLMDVQPRKGENRYEALGRISRGLKVFAKEQRVVVVALAQLKRETDERSGQAPRLSDLRESGNLEQDADQVWLLWRREQRGRPAGTVQLRVAKNRQGPTASVELDWYAEAMKFLELDDEG